MNMNDITLKCSNQQVIVLANCQKKCGSISHPCEGQGSQFFYFSFLLIEIAIIKDNVVEY